MSALTHGSLFSGLGGFDLAGDRAGLTTLWQVEIDPIARSVLARHWPDVTRYEDVTTVSGHDLAPVDVITAGFPCQDLSVAGKRGGLEGARSGLFWEITRIVTEMREVTDGRSPTLVVLENVPGLSSADDGRALAHVIRGLGECGCLAVGWRILDAQYFRIPQRRRRIFLVGDLGGRRSSTVLALADSLRGHPAPRRAEGQTVAPPIASSTQRGGSGRRYGECADTATSLAYQATGDAFWREGANPLAASDDNGSNHVVASAGHHGHSSPRGDGSDNLVIACGCGHVFIGEVDAVCPACGQIRDAQVTVLGFSPTNRNPEDGNYEDVSPTLKVGSGPTAIAFDTTQITSPLNYSSPQPGDPCHPLAAGAHPPAIFEARYARNGRGAPEAVCPPLKAQSGQTGKGDSSPLVFQARYFSDRERMGGMPSEIAHPLTADAGNGDSQPLVAFQQNQRNEVRLLGGDGQQAGALPAQPGMKQQNYVANTMTVRRLTPTECSRLQGYPDDFIPSTIADSHHYRLLGNSVAVPVVEWLLRRVVAAMAE